VTPSATIGRDGEIGTQRILPANLLSAHNLPAYYVPVYYVPATPGGGYVGGVYYPGLQRNLRIAPGSQPYISWEKGEQHEYPYGHEVGAACYTVQSGDSLSKIATTYGSGSANNVNKIYYSNQATIGSNPNLIYAGQKPHIP
jgi:hypothetical protein